MKLLKSNDYFQSSDLALCATLCCHGYHIEAINKQSAHKAIFLIKKDERLNNLIRKYWAHQLRVEPIDYFNFLKEIKTRLHGL